MAFTHNASGDYVAVKASVNCFNLNDRNIVVLQNMISDFTQNCQYAHMKCAT